jgi:hypothetical protein
LQICSTKPRTPNLYRMFLIRWSKIQDPLIAWEAQIAYKSCPTLKCSTLTSAVPPTHKPPTPPRSYSPDPPADAVVSHRPRVRAARGSAAPPPPSYPAVEATAAGSLDRCSAASTKLQTHTPAHLPRRRRRDGQRALAGEQAAQDPLCLQGPPPLAQDRYSNYS